MRTPAAALVGGVALWLVATPARSEYEQCTAKNDYFEKALAPVRACAASTACSDASGGSPASFDELAKMKTELQLPPACVLEALQTTPARGPKFAACEADMASPRSVRMPRPCVSERYHFAVYSGYVNAMSCLGIDPRELFGLFNAESNFQVNIGSPSGAWGAGQLTPIAIATINARKSLAALAEKKECEPVKELLTAPMAPRRVCEMIEPPGNPTRNFLYSGEAFLIFKGLAARTMNAHKNFSGLTADARARILFDLTAYSYNGGGVGVAQALSVYFQENPGKVTSEKAFRDSFRQYLLANFGASIPYYSARPEVLTAKRVEVSAYVRTIRGRTAALEKKLGVKCSL